jgi:hypothetical protein
MCAPSSSLTLLIWGACSNPSGLGFEPLISRAAAGWQQGAPPSFYISKTWGLAVEPAHELLISNPPESRAPVAPALTEWASRPLVGNRTL